MSPTTARRPRLLPLVLFLCAPSAFAGDEDVSAWPSFRGERARGIAEGAALPQSWDVESGRNVVWRTKVPGLAHSSPVIHGDRVFVTSAVRLEGDAELSSLYGSPGYGAGESVPDEGRHAFRLYCLSRETGEVLWERTAHEGVPKVKRHPKSTHANPTPACDAERVVAFFASEGLYCYDHAGELLWKKDLGVLDTGAPNSDMPNVDELQWGFASSPILYDGKVYLQCDVQDQSYVCALDAKTGEEVWKTLREEDPTWCTPTACDQGPGGRAQIILNGYQHIGGYDARTGEELWKLQGGGDVPVPTPVVEHGLVFLTSSHGPMRPLYALSVEAEGELDFDVDENDALIWYHPRRGVYMQTPLIVGDEVYACSDGGILACFDAWTGEMVYRERLGDGKSGFSASGIAGDGKLYFTSESGDVHVVRAGRDFEVLGVHSLGETCMATPAATKGRIVWRMVGHVIAVEAGEEDEAEPRSDGGR